MAKKVVHKYDYIGHIQRPDGTVAELAGTREADTPNAVYHWLAGMAAEMEGWLISQSISQSTAAGDVSVFHPEVKALPPPGKKIVPVQPKQVTSDVFGSRKYFGQYHSTYVGAKVCTYKVTGEQ